MSADPVAMLAGVGALSMSCICSSLVAGAMGGSNSGDDSSGAGSTPTPTPPNPNGKVIKGYSRNGLMADDGGVFKGADMAACRATAKKLGYPGVGHRNSTHGSDPHKNSCFFYQGIETGYAGDEADTVHSIACTDPSKTWAECTKTGGALAGYTGKHLSSQTSTKHPGTSLEECRALAKEWGHPGVGYRTIGHGVAEWQNTCFSYDAIDTAFNGNLGDRAHVSACTDASKTWPNC
jgi:hypothetical protein